MSKPQKLREFAEYYLSSFPAEAEDNGIFLTAGEISKLPANKQKIGDIIVVSIPDSLSHKKQEIGKLLLLMDSKARLVLNDNGISGKLRTPNREIIANRNENEFAVSAKVTEILKITETTKIIKTSKITETIHKENGCKFKLDVSKIMFSKGNLNEKRNLISECAGETVVDMFAGIGYFSIPIAVYSNPARIIAVELNPVSYGYLCENIRLNGVQDIFDPICGDCQTSTPENVADRVLMGYVGTTHEYLETGIKAIKKEGGFLYYHETVHEKDWPDRPVLRIKDAAEKCGRSTEILETRIIKKYSPGVYHVVIDVKIQ
ncbi:class I SAM-dependent methyltransferase family protein [Methanimicrococcus sp. OttesenSCG-928-J09]|nr:class I SAM-dependent methyltransferase family protein [Methanimicrococcus sp. OttesenSCG-928-J09]